MKGSTFPKNGGHGTPSASITAAVLNGSITLAVGAVFAPVIGALSPGAISGASEAAVLTIARDSTADFIASKVTGAIFNSASGASASDAPKDHIGAALTRAAARTILATLAEWANLDNRQFPQGDELEILRDLDQSSRTLLESGDLGRTPLYLTDWLAALEKARFLDIPEKFSIAWYLGEPGHAPLAPCSFSDWFHWRYPAAFRLQFADELGRDHTAERDFARLVRERILNLLFQTIKDGLEVNIRLNGLCEKLDRYDQQWVGDMAGQARAAIVEILPDLAAKFLSMAGLDVAELGEMIDAGFARLDADAKRALDEDPREHRHTRAELTRAIEGAVARIIAATGASEKPALPWQIQLDRYALFAIRNFGRIELLQALARSEEDALISLGELFVEPEIATMGDPRRRYSEHPIEDCHGGKVDHDEMPTRLRGSEAFGALGGITTRRAALDALRDPGQSLSIILGDSGSGKSTLFRVLVLQWAERHLFRGAGREDRPQHEPVPLLTEVRSWLAARDRAPELTLHGYHCRESGREYHFHPRDLETAIADGRAILLVDGFDDAFVRQTRDNLREQICALALWYPALRVLVTSRGLRFDPAPWRDATMQPGGRRWVFHTVEPFDDQRIQSFLAKWHRAGQGEPALRERRSASLAAAIATHPRIRRLAINPMLITLFCIVARGGPAEGGIAAADISRKDLYEGAERLIFNRWDGDKGLPLIEAGATARLPILSFANKRSFFLRVAATMADNAETAARSARKKAASARKNLDLASLPDSNQIHETALVSILKDLALADAPADVVSILRERNYVLCYRGDSTYSFIHRSFLEYFTALNWAEGYANGEYSGIGDLFTAVFVPRWQDGRWHETFRFLIALLRNPVAVQCLDLLAALPPDKAKGDTVDTAGGVIQRERDALVLAAELVKELSPYVHTGGSRPALARPRRTPREVAEEWKGELINFARSRWDCAKAGRDQYELRSSLRRRALNAIATLWAGCAETYRELAVPIPKPEPGRVQLTDFAEALEAGWGAGAEVKSFLTALIEARLPGGTPAEPDAEVRAEAVAALGYGWKADAEVMAVLRCVVEGWTAKGKHVEPDGGVRAEAESWLAD